MTDEASIEEALTVLLTRTIKDFDNNNLFALFKVGLILGFGDAIKWRDQNPSKEVLEVVSTLGSFKGIKEDSRDSIGQALKAFYTKHGVE